MDEEIDFVEGDFEVPRFEDMTREELLETVKAMEHHHQEHHQMMEVMRGRLNTVLGELKEIRSLMGVVDEVEDA